MGIRRQDSGQGTTTITKKEVILEVMLLAFRIVLLSVEIVYIMRHSHFVTALFLPIN